MAGAAEEQTMTIVSSNRSVEQKRVSTSVSND